MPLRASAMSEILILGEYSPKRHLRPDKPRRAFGRGLFPPIATLRGWGVLKPLATRDCRSLIWNVRLVGILVVVAVPVQIPVHLAWGTLKLCLLGIYHVPRVQSKGRGRIPSIYAILPASRPYLKNMSSHLKYISVFCAICALCSRLFGETSQTFLDLSESSPENPAIESSLSWQNYLELSSGVIDSREFSDRLSWLLPPSSPTVQVYREKSGYVEIDLPGGTVGRLELRAPGASPNHPNKFWRSAEEFVPSGKLPLSGLRVAIDPGHIGGRWAEQEGRLFLGTCGTRIAEGDMTLRVARILRHLLISSGANVALTREGSEPLGGSGPTKFRQRAYENLRKAARPVGESALQRESTRILLQQHEIETRARLINEVIRPDVAICLHFNAEPWGTRSRPHFSSNNHFHVIIGGHYRPSEASSGTQRLDLIRRIIEGTHLEEQPLATVIARELSRATGLPPFSYGKASEVASAVPGTPYVWRRNLLATRMFHCPVVFLEPFVMNNADFVAAVRSADSEWRTASSNPDIYEQYAYGVYAGILRHYGKAKTPRPKNHGVDPYAPQWLETSRPPLD